MKRFLFTLLTFTLGSCYLFGNCCEQNCCEPFCPSDCIQVGVTLMYDELVDDFGIGLAFQNCCYEAGVNASIDHNITNEDVKYTEYFLGAYLGLRRAICCDLYGALGVMGNYGFFSGNQGRAGITRHPYVVGPYIGLAYQPRSYVQIFTRIMPYSYERSNVNLREHEFFQEGQIGMTFFF